MNIGDVLYIKPNFYTEYMGANDAPRQARVVYIHPEGRFFVVESRRDLGVPWRETFYPYNRGSRTLWTSPRRICRMKRSCFE